MLGWHPINVFGGIAQWLTDKGTRFGRNDVGCSIPARYHFAIFKIITIIFIIVLLLLYVIMVYKPV